MYFHELRTGYRALFLIIFALVLLIPCVAHAAAPADPTDLLATASSPTQALFTWTESSTDVELPSGTT